MFYFQLQCGSDPDEFSEAKVDELEDLMLRAAQMANYLGVDLRDVCVNAAAKFLENRREDLLSDAVDVVHGRDPERYVLPEIAEEPELGV